MITIPGRIPITIHPLFWVTAIIIGFLASGGRLVGAFLWLGAIFFSVLIHELGHALTARLFRLKPRIALVALGGVTTYEGGEKLSRWKQFLIVLNGPLFGFLLFVVAWLFLKMGPTGVLHLILGIFVWINLVWTVLNLIPVLPLDGGQLLRIVLEGIFGAKGFSYSLMVGMVISSGLCITFFVLQNFLAGALFFLFAFQSFDLYRRMKKLSEEDRVDTVKNAIEEAERDLQSGNKERALSEFQRIYDQTHAGIIHNLAAQYLAFLKFEKGESEEAYKLLKELRSELNGDALCLLQKAAFEQKDFPLVAEISGTCFQTMPVKEVALRNAFACASLGQAKPAIGWLEAAFQGGLENIAEILQESYFDSIRETSLFKQFQKIHAQKLT